MAVIRKERYLREIASCVRKGSLRFDEVDRPVLQVGGRDCYLSGLSYDVLSGEIVYTLSDKAGNVLPSAHGVRPVEGLPAGVLSDLAVKAGRYSRLRADKERNIANIRSRVLASTLSL